ncbi:hypothetical protein LCGC14_3002030 [marine sediment metagenome]|uniref:Uncharacterized protein n=1 Tax=marine sediment metagenome TaxID=412755 RepID=A0A0F8Z8B8_9ZZZZ
MTQKRLYPTVREKIEVDILTYNPAISLEELKKRVDKEILKQLRALWEVMKNGNAKSIE